jgi:hypothetical protein
MVVISLFKKKLLCEGILGAIILLIYSTFFRANYFLPIVHILRFLKIKEKVI